MTKLRDELIEEFGYDHDAVFDLIKETSKECFWAARMYMYWHIMRGDSMKTLSYNFLYLGQSTIPQYFRNLIKKSKARRNQ